MDINNAPSRELSKLLPIVSNVNVLFLENIYACPFDNCYNYFFFLVLILLHMQRISSLLHFGNKRSRFSNFSIFYVTDEMIDCNYYSRQHSVHNGCFSP